VGNFPLLEGAGVVWGGGLNKITKPNVKVFGLNYFQENINFCINFSHKRNEAKREGRGGGPPFGPSAYASVINAGINGEFLGGDERRGRNKIKM